MIVKKIGAKLLLDSKLYVLLYRVSLLAMVLSPFLMLVFIEQKDKNSFQ
jgi:hypothetical protein